MAIWKQPEEKKWWSFIADGRCLDTLQECAEVYREKMRLRDLIGVSVEPATSEQLIKVNAKTVLYKRITKKMSEAAKQLCEQNDKENKMHDAAQD